MHSENKERRVDGAGNNAIYEYVVCNVVFVHFNTVESVIFWSMKFEALTLI